MRYDVGMKATPIDISGPPLFTVWQRFARLPQWRAALVTDARTAQELADGLARRAARDGVAGHEVRVLPHTVAPPS